MATDPLDPAPLLQVQSYVPAWLVRQSGSEPGSLTEPGGQMVRGALMLADVSGFTALAERLRQQGAEGAEILWQQVDGYFGRMLEIIDLHGGEVLRFPGDAAVVLFPEEGYESDPLERAAACGVSLQQNLGRYPTSDGGVLRIRVSISAGQVLVAWVGGVLGRWEAMVLGDPLTELGKISGAASIGDVMVHRRLAGRLSSKISWEKGPDGHARLKQYRDPAASVSPGPRLPVAADPKLIRPFVAQAVLDRIDAGHSRWIAELRTLSVVLASVHGVHDVGESIGMHTIAPLQDAFSSLQRSVYRFGGSINLFLQDDKGLILVAAWGLPGRTHEDDAVRAVRASLRIRRVLEEHGLAASVGVARGKVFCGARGGGSRFEYGVLGSPVNLAARLAGQARGGILCSVEVRKFTHEKIRFTSGPQLRLRGFREPVDSWIPTPVERKGVGSIRPVFGRDEEMVQLVSLVEQLGAGQGSTVVIEGEPGMGKSVLVGALATELHRRELPMLQGSADAVDRQSAYHAFGGVFDQIMGLEPGLSPEQRKSRALSWLDDHLEVAELAPLFGPLLRIGIPDNERSAAIVGQARAETALEIFVGLLEEIEHPVIVIDDIQWLDSASWQLLRAARRAMGSAMFVLITRPAESYPSEAYDVLRAEAGVKHIYLGPLEETGLEQLLCSRLSAERIAPTLSKFIRNRSEGHPFYAEEIALALHGRGQVEVTDGEARLTHDVDGSTIILPGTLEGVINSRIDRLSATQQLALKTASVVGRSFLADCVADVYPVDVDRAVLNSELQELVNGGLIEVEGASPTLWYRFKHIITQQVAYELLLFEQRRRLHRSIAEWLEAGHAGDPAAFYARAAWHWQHTNETDKTIDALEAAGEQAFGTFAEQEAVEFLSGALELCSGGGVHVEPARIARWQRVIGEARMRLGQLDKALDHLVEANRLLGYRVPTNSFAVVMYLLVEIVRQSLRHLGWTKPALARDPKTRLDAAHAHLELSLMAYFLRKIPLVLYGGGRGLNLAQDVGPSPDLARALAQWGVIMSGLPLHTAAETYSLEALRIAEQFDDKYSLGNAQHYRGIIHLSMARVDEGISILEEARENYSLVGNGRRVQEATVSIVFALIPAGRYPEAERELDRLEQLANSRGDSQALFWADVKRAEISWRRGKAYGQLDRLGAAESEDEVYVVRAQGLHTLLLLGAGDLPGATRAAQPLLKLGRPTSFIESLGYFALFRLALEQARLERGKLRLARKRVGQLKTFGEIFPFGKALWALAVAELASVVGDEAATREACEACIQVCTELGCPWEEAAAHAILQGLGGPGDDAHGERVRELHQRLGLEPGERSAA